MIDIAGWVVWGLIALWSVAILLPAFITQAGGQTRLQVGTQALVISAGLIVTATFPVSKLHLLWIFPMAYIVSGATWRFIGAGRTVARKRRFLNQLHRGEITGEQWVRKCKELDGLAGPTAE